MDFLFCFPLFTILLAMSMSKSSEVAPVTTVFGNKSFSSEDSNNIGTLLSKKLGKDTLASRVGAGNGT